MNPIDEFRYLDHLLNELTSGRMRLLEGDEDVTQREVGRLAMEIAAIESMLASVDSDQRER
ncbi:MAG TPA: hypothetical protein VMT68_09335 [Caulobacteraceae bacterium]|nr:hypothetical protein [Caulobacteraceae bacterium]